MNIFDGVFEGCSAKTVRVCNRFLFFARTAAAAYDDITRLSTVFCSDARFSAHKQFHTRKATLKCSVLQRSFLSSNTLRASTTHEAKHVGAITGCYLFRDENRISAPDFSNSGVFATCPMSSDLLRLRLNGKGEGCVSKE